MSLYLYYYLNQDGSVPVFDSLEVEDPGEAVRFGAQLLRRAPERAAVEVWQGERQIATVKKDGLTS